MRTNLEPVSPEELMAYLDGELPGDRAAFVAAHLEECRECQIQAAEFKSVSEHLTEWVVEKKPVEISADLAKALDEREQSAQTTSSRGQRNWFGGGRFHQFAPWAGGALVGGLAAILIAFSLVFSVGKGEHEPSPIASRETAMSGQSVTESSPRLSAPMAVPPAPGGNRDRLASNAASMRNDAVSVELAKRQQQADISSNLETRQGSQLSSFLETKNATEPPGAPMILRTAQVTVVTQNLDQARAAMDKIVQRYSGYVGDLTVSAPSDGPRKLTATLRVPANQLAAALAELKTLGRVESESQSGQDVTAQYVDLEARLSNSRNTQQRLLDLLRQRTGKLSDVLEVETELSRVREEIERMEGERRLLAKQVEYATLTATVTEEYKTPARALPDSAGTRFRNAAVDGYQSVVTFVIDVGLFLVSDGPMLLLWVAILFFPARYAWRKWRHRDDPPSQE